MKQRNMGRLGKLRADYKKKKSRRDKESDRVGAGRSISP